MNIITASAIALLSLSTVGNPAPKQSKMPSMQVAQSNITCFKSGEETSGMNKICYYDCLGSRVAINISSISLCPLTIKR